MLSCPGCNLKMETVKDGALRSWRCGGCSARAVNLAVLRKAGANPQQVSTIWRAAGAPGPSGPACPSCRRATRQVDPSGKLELDVCRSCMLLFFDAGELEQLVVPPEPAPTPAPTATAKLTSTPEAASPEQLARQEYARVMVESELSQLSQSTDTTESWRGLLGWLGMEVEGHERKSRALVTRTLMLLLIAVVVFGGTAANPDAVELLAFFTTDPLRHLGLSMVLHPLLQTDVFELFVVGYVLLFYGADIEHQLGSFGLLVFGLSIALGTAIGGILLGSGEGWLCGAGGLCTGLITYYSLCYPKRRVRLDRAGFEDLTVRRFSSLGTPTARFVIHDDKQSSFLHVPPWLIYVGFHALFWELRMESQGWTSEAFENLFLMDGIAHILGIGVAVGAWYLLQARPTPRARRRRPTPD